MRESVILTDVHSLRMLRTTEASRFRKFFHFYAEFSEFFPKIGFIDFELPPNILQRSVLVCLQFIMITPGLRFLWLFGISPILAPI